MQVLSDPTLRYLGAHADVLVILTRLSLFAQTAPMLTPEQQRENALSFVEPLQAAINEHHIDEERALFTRLAELARTPEEKELIQSQIGQLTREHRLIESIWSDIRDTLVKLAEGSADMPDRKQCADLLTRYQKHATDEETVLLPLGQQILSGSGQGAPAGPGDLRHRVNDLPRYI